MKLVDEEPCPCGSGRLYGECHKVMLRTTTTVADLSHVPLTVIPEPDPNTRAVWEKIGPETTFVVDRDGRYSFDCGSCGAPLLVLRDCQQVSGIVLRCAACGNFNEVTGTLFTRNAGAAIAAPGPPGIGGPMYQDQELRLSDLVTHHSPVIEGGRFVRCRLIGPAVLLPLESKFYRCGLGGPPDQVFWERTQDRRQSSGAIVAKACLFEDCTFVGVGYALTADEIEVWKKSVAEVATG